MIKYFTRSYFFLEFYLMFIESLMLKLQKEISQNLKMLEKLELVNSSISLKKVIHEIER